jgi:hypothetical protein
MMGIQGMLTNWTGQVDTTEDTEVKDGVSKSSLVQEPDVTDRRGHQSLHGRHAEAHKSARSNKRPKRLGLGAPEARNHQTERRHEIDGPLADLYSESVEKERTDSDGGYTGALTSESKGL